jgi:hypothetical protein
MFSLKMGKYFSMVFQTSCPFLNQFHFLDYAMPEIEVIPPITGLPYKVGAQNRQRENSHPNHIIIVPGL